MFKHGLMNTGWITAFAFFAAVAVCFGGEVKKVEEETFPLKSGARVTLIADEGDVVVNGWNREEAKLKITKRVWHRDRQRAEDFLEELRVDVDHSQDRLYIREVERHEKSGFWGFFDSDSWRSGFGYRIDYELMVPAEVQLKLTADEGDVEVSEIAGELILDVDEGNALMNALRSSRIDLRVDEGDVVCKNFQGRNAVFLARVDEGSIRIANGVFQDIELESDEGDFDLIDIRVKDCRFRTDEGRVEAKLTLAPEANCKITTDEGDVILFLPENLNARVRLETDEGYIRSDYRMSVRKAGEDGERIEETFGDGKAYLDVYAEEGDIILKKR